jgi:molybdenum-dependent DNA-binding transcriptional regulator ModE
MPSAQKEGFRVCLGGLRIEMEMRHARPWPGGAAHKQARIDSFTPRAARPIVVCFRFSRSSPCIPCLSTPSRRHAARHRLPSNPHRSRAVFSIELVEALREVARHGNLTRAASAMDLSKSTVSKYITELEAQVGVQLLQRSTRAVLLTDAGRHLLKRSVALVDLARRIQSELDAHGASAR